MFKSFKFKINLNRKTIFFVFYIYALFHSQCVLCRYKVGLKNYLSWQDFFQSNTSRITSNQYFRWKIFDKLKLHVCKIFLPSLEGIIASLILLNSYEFYIQVCLRCHDRGCPENPETCPVFCRPRNSQGTILCKSSGI